jgi:hypothetical protein
VLVRFTGRALFATVGEMPSITTAPFQIGTNSSKNLRAQSTQRPGDDHALNLGNHGFCRDADTTFDRTRNHRWKPENRQCAWARRTPRETKSLCSRIGNRTAVGPHGSDTPISRPAQTRIIGLVQNRKPAPASLTEPVRRRRNRVRSKQARGKPGRRSSWSIAPRHVRG